MMRMNTSAEDAALSATTRNKLSGVTGNNATTISLLLLGFLLFVPQQQTSALSCIGQKRLCTVSTTCFAIPNRDGVNNSLLPTIPEYLNDNVLGYEEDGVNEDNTTNDAAIHHSTLFEHQNNENNLHNNISDKRLITVSSHIELPFSAEVAYDAYSNLTRQPSWSSWLDSVVLSEDNPEESRWTIKVMGIKYSWTAIALHNERPHTVQWRSTTGLSNYGIVRFERRGMHSTWMTLNMTFIAPRAVAALFRKSQKLAHIVETMLVQSLRKFRDIVVEVDLKKPLNDP